MTSTQAKLERIFEFVNDLEALLAEEKYQEFNQQQALFGDLLKDFLSKHSENELVSVMEQLKKLQNMVKSLQDEANNYAQALKQKSLSLQRNKDKIKAYK